MGKISRKTNGIVKTTYTTEILKLSNYQINNINHI